MSDESLREFQLNGKQLVFLFMASTIVAVVIFLCGVMVGRGVSAAQAAVVSESAAEPGDPTAGELAVLPPATTPSLPSSALPPVSDDLSSLTAAEDLTMREQRLDMPKVAAVPVAQPIVARPVAARAEPTESIQPPSAGFVVQVAATPKRAEADAIRTRLERKGYPAFVTTSGRLFRVRVGTYEDRAAATAVAAQLEAQERFKPWVTR